VKECEDDSLSLASIINFLSFELSFFLSFFSLGVLQRVGCTILNKL